MRLPWARRQRPADAVPDDTDEAVRARRRAEAALRTARDQGGEVRRVADAAMHHQRVNHFAELIAETFWGNR